MAECPSEEQLAGLAADACSEEDARALERHIRKCGRCRGWLQQHQDAAAWLDGLRAVADQGVFGGRSCARVTAMPGADSPAARPLDVRAMLGAMPEIAECDVVRELSRGGQGIVYEAVQRSTKRRVAVKLIHARLSDSIPARKRFEREIELIAQLRHPNIIAIFQSGTLADERRYYVMDYVAGVPLHHYVRDNRLTLEDVLKLVATVCDAVQYAHQHGIIHRDLKPSNILVDSDGVPRILDFGMAKQLTEPSATLITLSQEILGTPAYMSPEQVRGETGDIDTRTDVYALGVILYELLTGRYPYPVEGRLTDVVRHIAETPPAAPSQVWSSDTGVTRRSAHRPRSDVCPIDQEVETIILKALAKEMNRRYQSAGEVARDIRLYLANEPIVARRDSSWYVLRKTLRRYRAAAAVSAAFAVVLAVAATVAAVNWRLAAQRLREVTDSHAVNDLFSMHAGQEPTLDIELHAANLDRYRQFVRENADNSQLQQVARQIESEQVALLEKLNAALATNRLTSVVQLAAEDPKFEQIAREIDTRSDSENLIERLVRRLELRVWVPPPAGRCQETLNSLATLARLDPENATARLAWSRLEQTAKARFTERPGGFQSCEPGAVPTGWYAQKGEPIAVVGPRRALLVKSTVANTGTACYPVVPEWDFPILRVVTTIRFPELPHPNGGTFGCELRSGKLRDQRICGWVVRDGRFAVDAQSAAGKEPLRVEGPAVDSNVPCQIELRYFSGRGTYDILVNGHYLVEEATCALTTPVCALIFSAGKGMRALVDDVVVDAPDWPLKQYVGSEIPLITHDELGLRLLGFLRVDVSTFVVHDFDSDGRPELVLGGPDPGTLDFYHVQLNSRSGTHEFLRRVKLTSEARLLPATMLGSHLAVFGFQEMIEDTPDQARQENRLRLLAIGPDLSASAVCHWTCTELGGSIAAVRLGPQRNGFVVGQSYRQRTISILEPVTPGADAACPCLGQYAPCTPGAPEPSDVCSIVPVGPNSDGSDDLLLGLGAWNGYCAALVKLAAGQPPSALDQEVAMDDGRVSAWVLPVQPLTGPVGKTRLALAELEPGTLHVVAASECRSSQGAQDIDPHTGSGIRVWPIDELRADSSSAPCWFDACDAQAVAAGQLAGRGVFAAASIEPNSHGRGHNLRVRVLGKNGSDVTPLWEAMLVDAPFQRIHQLAFEDVDGDNRPELLVDIGGYGILIFATEEEHSAADDTVFKTLPSQPPRPPASCATAG